MSFGSNLLEIRLERKLSQEELAERLDVSRLTIHRWENDKSAPNVNQIEALCNVFGLNVSCFFEESGSTSEFAPASEAEEKLCLKTSTRKRELITLVISSIVLLLCIALIVIMGTPQEFILDKVMFGENFVQVKRRYINLPAFIICIVLFFIALIVFVMSIKRLANRKKNEDE